jgi:hypothetical protein
MNILSKVVLFSVFNCAEKCAVLLLNALDIRVITYYVLLGIAYYYYSIIRYT